MERSILSADEVKGMAARILKEEFARDRLDPDSLGLVQADSEPGAEVWTLEWYHAPGAPIDHAATVKARGRLASDVLRAGDPRLILLRHRFRPAHAPAA